MTHEVSASHTQTHSQTEEVGFGGHKDPPLFRHNATMTPLCLSRTKLLLPAIVIVLCCCWRQRVRNWYCQCKVHNSSQLLNRADIVQLLCWRNGEEGGEWNHHRGTLNLCLIIFSWVELHWNCDNSVDLFHTCAHISLSRGVRTCLQLCQSMLYAAVFMFFAKTWILKFVCLFDDLCVFFLFLNKFACICSARLTWILRASREPIYLVGILPLELLGSLVRALSMNTNT